MATADLIETRLTEDRLESSPAQPVESWAPPLAPASTPDTECIPLREEALCPPVTEEHRFRFPEHIGLLLPEVGFWPRRKRIAAAAIATAVGALALAYVLGSSPAKNAPTQTAQVAGAAQASAPAPVGAPARIAQSPPAELTAVAWPDLPASLTVAASPQLATAAPVGNTATRQAVPALPKRDVVFSQRAGVNIRSTPAANSAVLGNAAKGARFKVIKREGEWVQVENGQLKGWVRSQFLAAKERP